MNYWEVTFDVVFRLQSADPSSESSKREASAKGGLAGFVDKEGVVKGADVVDNGSFKGASLDFTGVEAKLFGLSKNPSWTSSWIDFSKPVAPSCLRGALLFGLNKLGLTVLRLRDGLSNLLRELKVRRLPPTSFSSSGTIKVLWPSVLSGFSTVRSVVVVEDSKLFQIV